MAKTQSIASLNELGQSIWYDNLSRDVLQNGRLRSYIESGVTGLTSNPTIFKKAIADSSLYDDDIRRLSSQGLSGEAICEELMLRDVGTAADLLRPTFEHTAGIDGYASMEVSPLLAHDTGATVKAAKSLWRRLGRPNVMIKVPATAEGIPGIEELLIAGVNVNITLIFSRHIYEQVAEAFLRALEARLQEGESIRHLASVASFFVSRVDSICEQKLKTLITSGKLNEAKAGRYIGTMGIANSRLAYRSFRTLFSSERFQALEREGGRLQRPLWASTGTKNPGFDPLLYVSNLAGRHTVNTLPPQTLDTLLGNGPIKGHLEEGLDEAQKLLQSFEEVGQVDFQALLQELQVDGVKIFADSFRELLQSVESKMEGLRAGP